MKNIFLLIFICNSLIVNAQSMLDDIEDQEITEKVLNSFKSTRVINSHSMEMLPYGNLDFRILHRFDFVSAGPENFFGLDNARTIRLGLDYAVLDNLTIGIGRSSFRKDVDGFIRYRFLWQSKGKKSIPVSVIYTGGFVYTAQKGNIFSNPDINATFNRRLSYYHQILIGRKFSERVTVQIAPMLIHSNFVENNSAPNNVFATELGFRCKVSKRIAILLDYTFPFNNFPYTIAKNPVSLGVDIETGGHVFQLHFSNSPGINERSFLLEENGDILNYDLGFGFNISRLFQLNRKKVEGLE